MSGTPSTSTIETPGRSPFASASSAVVADRADRRVDDAQVGRPTRRDDTRIEAVDAGGVAGREGDDGLRRDAAERREMGHQPQDAERHDAGPRRGVVAEDHPAQGAGLARDGRARASAVRPLPQWTISIAIPDRRPARSMSASGSDVVPPLMWPDDVRLRLEDGVRARSRSSPRSTGRPCGTSRPSRALGAHATIGAASAPVFTDPSPISPMSLTPPAAISAKSASTSPCSRIGAPARTLTPPGRNVAYARCATIASALSPTMSFGRPGHVDLAGRDHRRDPAVEAGLDEVDRPLAGREVADDRVGVRVDQAGERRRAVRVDDDVGAVLVQAAADRRDPPVLDEDRVGVDERRRRCRRRRSGRCR